jgi:hypothetical protein
MAAGLGKKRERGRLVPLIAVAVEVNIAVPQQSIEASWRQKVSNGRSRFNKKSTNKLTKFFYLWRWTNEIVDKILKFHGHQQNCRQISWTNLEWKWRFGFWPTVGWISDDRLSIQGWPMTSGAGRTNGKGGGRRNHKINMTVKRVLGYLGLGRGETKERRIVERTEELS